MALADFHGRATTSASQILRGFDTAAFDEALLGHVVCIAFDGTAMSSSEGCATVDMLVRLLARLHPRLSVVALDPDAEDGAAQAANLALTINPAIEIRRDLDGAESCIVVGTTRPAYDVPVFFVGSDGWTAKLSRSGPVGSGSGTVPFGAGTAACLAAANVFRLIFGDQLEGGGCDGDLTLSTLTFARGHADAPASLTAEALNLGEAHLVGLGAIGNGVVWTLARTANIAGTLHLIDHETIDLPNLQRYALARRCDDGRVKVELALEALAGSGLRAVPHRVTFARYVDVIPRPRLDVVATALDTAEDRIAVQAALPGWVANAWTQPSDLGVSRHRFGDGGPCLACLYMPVGKTKDEDELVSDELSMTEARAEIRRLLQTGEPVGEAFLRRAAAAMNVEPEPLLPFSDKPLREFRQSAICGGLVMRLSGGRRAAPAIVPMPFQSALAGILLAAELVRHAAGVPLPTSTIHRINLLRPLGTHLRDPCAKDVSQRCICADPDFHDVFLHRHGAADPASVCPA
jgi:hypothetical protein